MRSLRSRLFVLWLLSIAASAAVGVLLLGLYRQSSAVQLDRADEAARQGCGRIGERFAYYASGWAGPVPAADASFRADLATVVAVALEGSALGGGVWQQPGGVLAAQGGVSPAMRDSLAAMAGALAAGEVVETVRIDEAGAVVVLEICGLPGPVTGLEGFAFARVEAAPGQVELRLGLAVLMALALGMTALLTLLVGGFARRVAGIERALAGPALPVLAPTGERELDRIVAALNGAGARLEAARLDGVRMAARVAQAERLAALGRVAAGVAHEIRNPIAAMRLRAENGLAGDDARRVAALQAVLAQIGRLDRLLGELLEMTQRRDARPVTTSFPAFLEGVAADYRGLGAEIVVAGEDFVAAVDPDLLRRALDGVLQNAVRHAETMVTLRGDLGDKVVRVTVADDGAGVAAAVRGTLFEPFVTGTPGGTGLGLSITREMVAAQGGRVWLAEGSGAVFVVEIPCQ